MTDQRPIDVSTLRDGDIVRAEGTDDTGPFAFEGTVRVDKWGVWVNVGGFSFCVHGDDPRKGLTSIRILRPVLVKGDRVEHVRGGDGIVEDVGSAGVFVRWSTGLQTMHEASDLTRLPTAPEPDPVCPFKPGDVVRYARDKQGHPQSFMDARRKVTNRLLTAGLWRVYYVYLDSGEAGYGRFQAGDSGWDWSDTLELAPEPAPIEAWDWWADEKGIPHVVEVLHDDSVGLRRWTASVVNRFVEPSLLRDYWTRLDGPPEPPEGSVVRLGQKGNRIPLAAMRCNDVWRVTGYQEPLSWADLTGSATVDLATLQIVHALGVE